MNTVYLGTSEFAAAVLRRIAASPHRPRLVVTRPDRPRGRGRRLASPPVADAARELGLELLAPESINAPDTIERIAEAAPEVVCVCAFGALIREPLLSAWPMLNIHPSLLPRWRGAAPVERAIMAGDSETGVTIMELEAGLDSGPIHRQAAEPIAGQDTYATLSGRLQELGARLLIDELDAPTPGVRQDERGATYAEKITAEDRRLDPMRPATELARIVRALEPHIVAYVEAGDRLGVHAARAVECGPAPGELSLSGRCPVLGCAEGGLELLTVQPAGRRAMSGEDYARGRGGPRG